MRRAATSTTLAATRTGPADDRSTVALVHGFAQTGRCLGPLADAVSAHWPTVLVDCPGHGGSVRHSTADLWSGARLLTATAGPGAYVGYSMGARLCLHAALAFPDVVQALVLIGGTAGLADDAERLERRRADHDLAAHLRYVGVGAFLDEWLALPMFSGLPDWARFEEERRTNTADGLAASLRHAGTGSMEPLWDRLGALRMPVLCITGSLDGRYGDLAERMVAAIGPAATHVVVEHAGHAAHLERPQETTEAITAFLRGATGAGA